MDIRRFAGEVSPWIFEINLRNLAEGWVEERLFKFLCMRILWSKMLIKVGRLNGDELYLDVTPGVLVSQIAEVVEGKWNLIKIRGGAR